MIDKIKQLVSDIIGFLSYDIWRVNRNDETRPRIVFYNITKTFILAIRNISSSQLNTKAAALTYRTILSIVPMLAVLFAIARGFGFQNIVRSQLFNIFSGQKDLLEKSMEFIDKSLEFAQSGVFLGIGVVLLLYTVINLLSSIEDTFNEIWSIKSGRSYFRLFTDYLALIVVTPIFLICNAGFSIILGATSELDVIGVVVTPFMKVIPYIITILLFTFLYAYIPNTKVKIKSALIAGFIAGTGFQIFQLLYIGGQIWISKYNAIYGSFAALPLFFLWLQMSWFICLFGVELSAANQNVNKFDFEKETDNISRRYKDFVMLLIMTLIVKRFEKGENPYTADELSAKHKIPTKLASEVLFSLQDMGLIIETPTKEALIPAYIPASDINQISVGSLFETVASYGSEDFLIDKDEEFKAEWNAILEIRQIVNKNEGSVLLKDL